MGSLSTWIAEQFDPTLMWDDLAWVRKRWPGRLVLKGVMDPDDARCAYDVGADAVVVSNHGGRQLDGAPSTITALPHVSRGLDPSLELWLDGGVRSGQDVLRALAMGASGVLIGRSFLYGLGAMGGPGVTKALEIIARELDLTMALCGLNDLARAKQALVFPLE